MLSARAVLDCFHRRPSDEDIILTTPTILPVVSTVKKYGELNSIQVCPISHSSQVSRVLKLTQDRGIKTIRSYDATYNRVDHLIDNEIENSKSFAFKREFLDGLKNRPITYFQGSAKDRFRYFSGALKNQVKSALSGKQLDISALRLKDFPKAKIIKFNTGNIGYSFDVVGTVVEPSSHSKLQPVISIERSSIIVLMPIENTRTKSMFNEFIFKLLETGFFSHFERVYLKFHPRYVGTVPVSKGSTLTTLDKDLPIELVDINSATVLMHHSSSDLHRVGRVANLSKLDSVTFQRAFEGIELFQEQVWRLLND